MVDAVGRHPLPWRREENGWTRLDPEPYMEDSDGRIVQLQVGNCIDSMNRAEVAALMRQLGDILLAPYRMIVAGGDAVPEGKLDSIVTWLDEHRRKVFAAGWRLQVVCANANAAQRRVSTWAQARDVELFIVEEVDYVIGGNMVALLPARNTLDIVREVRMDHGLPAYRVAPSELWAAPRPPTAADVDSVAYASGGGFLSKSIEFESVDEEEAG